MSWSRLAAAVLLFTAASARAQYTVLHHFDGASGAQPYGAVAFDPKGVLYGAADTGGSGFDPAAGAPVQTGNGLIYRIDGEGRFSVPETFVDGNGRGPLGRLFIDGFGDVFGTTQGGGWNLDGVLFRLRSDAPGSFRVLHQFFGTDGVAPYGGVVADARGRLYGSTFYGGASFDPAAVAASPGVLYRQDPDGSFEVLHSFAEDGSEGSGPVRELLLHGGHVWGATEYGGATGGVVFRWGPGRRLQAVSLSADTGLNGGGGLAAAGNHLYGLAVWGGAARLGTIYRVDSPNAARFTVAAVHSFSGPDGSNPAGTLARGPDGKLYGITTGNGSPGGGDPGAGGLGTVFRFDPATGAVTTLHRFTGPEGASPKTGPVIGPDGALYGTAIFGGDHGMGVVWRLGL